MVHYRPKPCVGSGYCCTKALCLLGVEKHGEMEGPCPSLRWDSEAGRHWCGLILDGEIDGWELAAGEGCCAPLNSWRGKVKDRSKGA
jgi:hypothetical protein